MADPNGAILSLDSRFLDDHPFRLNYARQFAAARTPRDGRMIRLYALESAPSLTGAMADHRYAMRVADIEAWLAKPNPAIWRDLQQNRGLILAGESLSPAAHALVHRLNAELRAPVSHVAPVDEVQAEPLDALMRSRTELLIILGGNKELYNLPLGLSVLRGAGEAIQFERVLPGSVITTIPMAIIFFIFQRYFVEGVNYSGLAGQ